MAWLCQWDIVAGIPIPPKRGCGWLRYGGTSYSCFIHLGGSHPMCVDALSCTCTKCVRSSYFTTSVSPSVWGWKAVDFVSLVSSIDHRLDQNVLRNLLSQSEIIDYGTPKCTHTRSNKSLVVDYAVIFFLHASIMASFKNLSTTTNTQSLSCLV